MQVCSQEEYQKVFQKLHALPAGVEHLIVQLGNSTLSAVGTCNEAECAHRNSNCVSAHGILRDRVIIKIQSSRFVGEVGVFWLERVCEQI